MATSTVLPSGGGLRPLERAVVSVAILVLVGCSNTFPNAPSPTTSLVIAGPTNLTVGLTGQFTAVTSPGDVVPGGLTWSSQTPLVASISVSGLLSAVSVGTTTVTGVAGNLTGRVSVVVQPQNTETTVIKGCPALVTSPGLYVLNTDLSNGVSPCITVSSVAGVQLDCAGHAITGIGASATSSLTIRNCSVTGNVELTNVSTTTVTNCDVSNGQVSVTNGTNVTIVSNSIAIAFTGLGSAISLESGANNAIRQNVLSGGYDGGKANVGTDDGIVLMSESNDDVENNTIRNFYDQGIEGADVVADSTMANNTFSNLGTAAIGAIWCPSWIDNVIKGNGVSLTPLLVGVGYNSGTLCGTKPASPAFTGNQFIGNIFRDPTTGTLGGPSGPTVVSGPSMSVSMPGSVGGNVLQNNDFGSNNGPELAPLSGFIDGGGNICAPLNPAISNFACIGGGSVGLSRLRQGRSSFPGVLPPLAATRDWAR